MIAIKPYLAWRFFDAKSREDVELAYDAAAAASSALPGEYDRFEIVRVLAFRDRVEDGPEVAIIGHNGELLIVDSFAVRRIPSHFMK